MDTIPKVSKADVFKALTPQVDSDEFYSYTHLQPTVEIHRPYESSRYSQIWQLEEGSFEEFLKAEELALQYFMMTAEKMQAINDENQLEILSNRYTEASIELYGAPKKAVAEAILNQLLGELGDLRTYSNVDEALVNFTAEQLPQPFETESQKRSELEHGAHIELLGKAVEDKYDDLFERIGFTEYDPDKIYQINEIVAVFEQCLEALKLSDEAWNEWEVIKDEDSAILSVNSPKKQIVVGMLRSPIAAQELKGLFAHEVLVHATRSVNGGKHDELLGSGLPDGAKAEEGTGVFIEYVVSGILPQKIIDRYLDIALAMGTIDGKKRTRAEIYTISMARSIVREQSGSSKAVNIEAIHKKVTTQVNRIFRGSRGDNHVAVFTKDIIYYQGFIEISQWVQDQIKAGVDPGDILDYLQAGKFDPTNEKHVAYFKKKTT